MIIDIINHLLHPITGCIRHIPCLITGRKLFKLLNDLVINLINMFHIRIRQCIKKCLFRRIIFVKCASSKSCIFYNIS